MRVPFRTAAVLAAAVILAAASLGHAQANFAGTWVLDPSQSQLPPRHQGAGGPDPGQAPRPPVKLNVEQTGDTVKATRTIARANRERSVSESYTVDGSEHTFTGPRNSTVVTRATWDGPRLRISSSRTMTGRSGGEIQMSRESVWTLSPDGQTLTIETSFQGPRGQGTAKRVYQRGA